MREIRFLKGFTLVEIVVSVVLLAIVSAGILSITLSSRKVINRSQRRYMANEVGQVVIESLRAYLGAEYWYNTSNPIYPNGTQCYNLNTPGDFLGVNSKFAGTEFATRYNCVWCYKIENVTGYDYRKATVEVNWTEIEL